MAVTANNPVDKAEPLFTLPPQRRSYVGWKTANVLFITINRNRGARTYHQRERLPARYSSHPLANFDPVALEPPLTDLQCITGGLA